MGDIELPHMTWMNCYQKDKEHILNNQKIATHYDDHTIHLGTKLMTLTLGMSDMCGQMNFPTQLTSQNVIPNFSTQLASQNVTPNCTALNTEPKTVSEAQSFQKGSICL